MEHQICLHLGSNMGDRSQNLAKAIVEINKKVGTVNKQSSIYQTEAWGETDQPDFLNQTILATTNLPPKTVLTTILRIEETMGRIREKKWGPRLIDIDLLFYGNLILETERLTLPHPQIPFRNFVLIPTMEIFGDFIHPVFDLSIEELYLRSQDEGEVFLLEEVV